MHTITTEVSRGLWKIISANLVASDTQQKSHFSPLVEELSGVISEKDLNTLSYTDYLEAKYE